MALRGHAKQHKRSSVSVDLGPAGLEPKSPVAIVEHEAIGEAEANVEELGDTTNDDLPVICNLFDWLQSAFDVD